MPPITALLHTSNDALRLGRALETLLPCAEILIVDHHSSDTTKRVARAYGARVLMAKDHAQAQHYLTDVRCEWILCLSPSESISEGLQATLFEWSSLPSTAVAGTPAFSVVVREQVHRDWHDLPEPATRLIPRHWSLWHGSLPAYQPSSSALAGELLRIAYP